MSRAARDEDDAARLREAQLRDIVVEATVDTIEEVAADVARRLADRLDGDVEVTVRVRRR